MAFRRCLAEVLAGLLLISACAQTRAAAPPDPSLVAAPRNRPPTTSTTSTTTPPTTTTRPATTTSSTVPVVTDAADGGSATREPVDEPFVPDDGLSPAVDVPVTTDLPPDVVSPELPPLPAVEGWAAFDESLRRQLLVGSNVGVSVAVAIDGEVVHATGLGARAAWTFDEVEPIDRFRIASVSKVITAIVTLQLVEEGLLAIDEPVGERLAGYLGVSPSDPLVYAMTPEQLLSHTAGFGPYRSLFFGHGAGSCAEAAAIALSGSVAPGGFQYSNMGYCLLGLLIEQATGQPYEEAVYQRLLVPLGITGMRLPATFDAGPDEAVHQSAAGRNYMEVLGGAGAWIASASDVVRIVDSLRIERDGWAPLSDEMLRRMQSALSIEPVFETAGYGLGLFLYPDGSFGHTGTIESTHAMVLSRPDGVTWAVLVNGEHPSNTDRLREMVDAAFAIAWPS